MNEVSAADGDETLVTVERVMGCEHAHEASRHAAAARGGSENASHRLADDARSVRLPDDAFVCLCEDVRVQHVRHAIADGYRDVELLKRHTGAGTGPCQGKLCHRGLLQCLQEAGLDERLPTPRPFVRPVPLALFAGRDDV
jgi:NAD(P)H-nitrite reductase large subunit